MQIKAADDPSAEIAALEQVAAALPVGSTTRKSAEQALASRRAGIRGEKEAAYEIEFYFGRSKNFATIHDLRIEVGELTAQIDHLILNRLGEIWVCETKHFAEGVSVNEHGEWVRYWKGRSTGIPSPIEQNRRHIFLLQRAFDDGLAPLPRRFGVAPMKPDFRSLVIVSNNARIGRPRRGHEVDGLDQVIKAEQLKSRVLNAIDRSSPARILRAMGTDGLEAFAHSLAGLHRPAGHADWQAQLGIEGVAMQPDVGTRAIVPARPASSELTNLPCTSCRRMVSFAEAKWCRLHRERFGGRLYCRTCQAGVGAG